MPGFLLHVGATVFCSHGGQAQPIDAVSPRAGERQPVVTMTSPYVIAGCPFVPPGGNGPCVTAQWVVGATRVVAGGAARAVANQPGDLRADGDATESGPDANAGGGTMSQFDYPFHFDTRGRTAGRDDDDHIRDLIEQVLFTAPGERVNRPTFGCGLMQLVFAPNSDELAAATQFLVQGALQQWLGDLIAVEAVQVEANDATLRVTIQYVIRRTRCARPRSSTRGGTGA